MTNSAYGIPPGSAAEEDPLDPHHNTSRKIRCQTHGICVGVLKVDIYRISLHSEKGKYEVED